MVNLRVRVAEIALIIILLMTILPRPVRASTFTVNTLDDHNDGVCNSVDCTLREALEAAQPAGTCDWGIQHIIDFSVSGTIVLDPALGPLPDLRCPLVIDGGGSVTISGGGVVDHALNAYTWDDSAFSTDEVVRGLTFRDFTSYALGAFIWGAPSGSLLVENSMFLSSPVGIVVEPHVSGSLTTLRQVTVDGASQWGVVIRATAGRVLVDSSTVTNCGTASGGGINVLRSGSGTVTLSHLTVSGNGIGIQVYASPTYAGSSVTEIIYSEIHSNSRQGVLLNGDGQPVSQVYVGVDSSLNYRHNDIFNNGRQGVLVYGQASDIWVWVNDIAGNAQEGLKVEAVGGSIRDLDVRYNFIYDNHGAGVVLTGDVTSSLIKGNRVGANGAMAPHPNGDGPGPQSDGGVVLIDGPSNNVVEYNTVAYSHYHNILISASSSNQIRYNRIWGDHALIPDGYHGIVVSDGSTSNVMSDNTISRHVAEGIVIIGDGTDGNSMINNKIGAYDVSGVYTGDPDDGNGAGIAVISASAPTDITFPFPVYAITPTGMQPGPERTIVIGNEIRGNNGDGIILIRTGGDNVEANLVQENARHGIYMIASHPTYVTRNQLLDNGGDGMRVEPFYGDLASPLDPNDDVLSGLPTHFQDNTIRGNAGYGLHILDNEWEPLSYSISSNTISGNSAGDAVKEWLGYVKVQDAHGDPVTGLTVRIYRGGDDGDSVPDYVSGAWDADGRYGPAGFVYTDVSTWWRIVQEEARGSTVYEYNPHTFGTPAGRLLGAYWWDGVYPVPPTESGGAFRSPPLSGVWRYQWALATYRAEEAGEGRTVAERQCRVLLSLSTSHRWVSPGSELTYRLSAENYCDRDVKVKVRVPIPSMVEPGEVTATSGSASVDRAGGELSWDLTLDGYSNETLEMSAILSQEAPLGAVISTRAEAECDPGCYVSSGGSDDPLTVSTFGDPTARVIGEVEKEVMPSRPVTVPLDLEELGKAKVRFSGCEGWNLSIRGMKDGWVSGRGEVRASAPADAVEGDSCTVVLTPSRIPRFMSAAGLRSLAIRLRVKGYPNVSAAIRPESDEVREGSILAVSAVVENGGTAQVNYTLTLSLGGLSLHTATTSPGELRSINGTLIWVYSSPPHSRRYLRVLLSVPRGIRSAEISGRLTYTWSGGNGSLELEGARIRVLPSGGGVGENESTGSSNASASASMTSNTSTSISPGINVSRAVILQRREGGGARDGGSAVDRGPVTSSKEPGGPTTTGDSVSEGPGRGFQSLEQLRLIVLVSLAAMLLYLFLPKDSVESQRGRSGSGRRRWG